MTDHDPPFTCPDCEETIIFEDDEYRYADSRFMPDGTRLCSWCFESMEQRLSTVVRYDAWPVHPESVCWGEHDFAVDAEYFDDLRSDHWFHRFGFGRAWVQTDGWRGHYTLTHSDQLVNVASGWVTGFPDETVAHKLDTIRLQEALNDGEHPPVPFYWVFQATSNVFSTASDLLVHRDDQEALQGWLKGLGFMNIERAFQ